MAQRPEYLTVPEVMARLRLGRTTVYEQARLYLATGGAEGIPCRRFGRSLRFRAAAFDTPGAEQQRRPRGRGRRSQPTSAAATPRPSTANSPAAPRPTGRRTRRATGTDQSSLPFTD